PGSPTRAGTLAARRGRGMVRARGGCCAQYGTSRTLGRPRRRTFWATPRAHEIAGSVVVQDQRADDILGGSWGAQVSGPVPRRPTDSREGIPVRGPPHLPGGEEALGVDLRPVSSPVACSSSRAV